MYPAGSVACLRNNLVYRRPCSSCGCGGRGGCSAVLAACCGCGGRVSTACRWCGVGAYPGSRCWGCPGACASRCGGCSAVLAGCCGCDGRPDACGCRCGDAGADVSLRVGEAAACCGVVAARRCEGCCDVRSCSSSESISLVLRDGFPVSCCGCPGAAPNACCGCGCPGACASRGCGWVVPAGCCGCGCGIDVSVSGCCGVVAARRCEGCSAVLADCCGCGSGIDVSVSGCCDCCPGAAPNACCG